MDYSNLSKSEMLFEDGKDTKGFISWILISDFMQVENIFLIKAMIMQLFLNY
jgi:hypothetical protein